MGKRANGEGSIYRQNNGLWAGSVTVGRNAQTGKLVRKYVYGKTKQEAQEKKATLLEQLRGGMAYIDADKMTVGQWVEKWLHTFAKTGVRANTYQGYRAMVNNYILPILGGVRLQKIKSIDIQHMVNHIVESGRSPRTVEAAYNVLRIALNKAFEDELIMRLPFKSVNLPKKRKKEYTPLSEEAWERLFAAAQNSPSMHTAICLLWATGISRSELLGLKWSDVDWQMSLIYIQRSNTITDDGPEIGGPKAETRRRKLPLPENILQEIKRYKAHYAAVRLAAKTWEDNDLIFPTSEGHLQDPRNWSKKFAKVAKNAGVTISPHDLRHDLASRLAAKGISIKDAQYQLGHSTSRMLLDVYTHRMTSGQEQIVMLLDSSFPALKDTQIAKT